MARGRALYDDAVSPYKDRDVLPQGLMGHALNPYIEDDPRYRPGQDPRINSALPGLLAAPYNMRQPGIRPIGLPADTGTPSAGRQTPVSNKNDTPFEARLRQQHLAQNDPIPLVGPQQRVTPPPHVTDDDSMDRAVERYTHYALSGRHAKDWYDESGNAILAHAGSPEAATPFAAGLAATSPNTDVASNTTHATTLHNQYMAGDPLAAGQFPNDMGARAERVYRQGEGVTGEKIGPFLSATAQSWEPGIAPHNYVNDVWNMRVLGYPGADGGLYRGSPTAAEHNYARIVGDRSRQRLQETTGQPWTPKQAQAASWTGIRQAINQSTPEDAGFSFEDALHRNYAHLSWESAPGEKSGKFPEYINAPPEQKEEYHRLIQHALTGPDGRDIINAHLGALTGQTYDAPGYFKGQASPGSVSPIAAGQMKGGAMGGVDASTAELANTRQRIYSLLTQQDVAAWHKPIWLGNIPVKDRNLVDVDIGRKLTPAETVGLAKAMHQETGTNWHSPVSTDYGFRWLNEPTFSNISNKDFVAAAHRAIARHDVLPPEVNARMGEAAQKGFYESTEEDKNHGDSYKAGLAAIRSPHLQRRAAELLATLGARVDAIDDAVSKKFGWTKGPDRSFWNAPEYQAYRRDNLPHPPLPGELKGTALEVAEGQPRLFGPGGQLEPKRPGPTPGLLT